MKIEWSEVYEFVETPQGPEPDWVMKELAQELQRLKVDVDVRLLGVPDAFPDGGGAFIKKMRPGSCRKRTPFPARNIYEFLRCRQLLSLVPRFTSKKWQRRCGKTAEVQGITCAGSALGVTLGSTVW